MIISDTLQQLRNYPAIQAHMQGVLEMGSASHFTDSFTTHLGGVAYIVETPQEVLDLLVKIPDWDLITPIDGKDGEAGYKACFLINNNSGGPTYFFPDHLFPQAVDADILLDGKSLEYYKEFDDVPS